MVWFAVTLGSYPQTNILVRSEREREREKKAEKERRRGGEREKNLKLKPAPILRSCLKGINRLS